MSILENLLIATEELSNSLNLDDKQCENTIIKYIVGPEKQNISVGNYLHNLEWFNVKKPLEVDKDLKGKVVIFDFFTYCCINCMHILPILKDLEDTYSVEDGLLIIGIHSAKFDNEKDSANIIAALQRYNIKHPVVNDSEGCLFQALEIPCWPTLVVLGPNGEGLYIHIGEANIEKLTYFVRTVLKYYKKQGLLSNHSLPIDHTTHILPQNETLLYPGKIAVSSTANWPCHNCINEQISGNNNDRMLAISDTGHHRIIIISSCGKVKYVVGGTEPGLVDGNFEDSRFNNPQGLIFQNHNFIYVADTENHCIRKIDLVQLKVSTVAGNGFQSNDRHGGQKWNNQGLSSPWDLCFVKKPTFDGQIFEPDGGNNEVLLIAMAGIHQIWALFLSDTMWWKGIIHPAGTCICIAGTGKEENRNNSYPHAAGFAQPSGICYSEENDAVFIADSESSSIRKICLSNGKVSAMAGGDRSPTDLFKFGDVDGKQYDAKLQHPLGVAFNSSEKVLYVADSYNHKIKIIDISNNDCKTFLGTGNPGIVMGTINHPANNQFHEPGGLCWSPEDSILYIADTNNHCIKAVNFNTNSVKKLEVKINTAKKFKHETPRKVVKRKEIILNSDGSSINLSLFISIPEGFTLTAGAPQLWHLSLPGDGWSAQNSEGKYKQKIDLVIRAPENVDNHTSSLFINFVLYLCKGDVECLVRKFQLEVLCSYSQSGSKVISESFEYEVV